MNGKEASKISLVIKLRQNELTHDR